jgi:uncharacterized membrane protein
VGLGHAHGHDHDAPRREVEAGAVRRLLFGAVAVIGIAALVGLAIWWPRDDPDVDRESLGFNERVEATVTSSEIGPCPGAVPEVPPGPPGDEAAPGDPGGPDVGGPDVGGAGGDDFGGDDGALTFECVRVTATITSGPNQGDVASLATSADFDSPVAQLEPGDEILLSDGGMELPDEMRYAFADMQRALPLVVLVALFALVVVALGRLRGLLALAGIVLSLGVLLVFIFPALLDGGSPLGVALTGATLIAFGTLYLAHGFNDRTTVALLGTMGSLGLTAALAVGFGKAAELSGLASEESLTLLSFAPDLDFRGLLLAAVVIGTLGVLDDVTVTQVAAVWELHRSNPSMGPRDLYGAGIRIGRDHIASTVNTLVLAYAAAALPLLLIYTQSGLAFGEVLTTETVAVEIVQTLVGSIGLVASVPLTTGLACWVITRSSAAGGDGGEDVPRWPGGGERVPQAAGWWDGAGTPGSAGPSGWAGPPGGPGAQGAPRQRGAPVGRGSIPDPDPPPAPRRRRARRDRDRDDEFWNNDPW